MPTWDSNLYLKFVNERARPASDLVARIAIDAPARVVDLGCGPGTSTVVLARRWPGAALTGVDFSADMLVAARKDYPQWTWIAGDIAGWKADQPFDVVFSNAAMQWVGDHTREFPRLLEQVAQGGALAVQFPINFDSPPQLLMRDLAASSTWRAFFASEPRTWHVHEPEFYYDLMAPRVAKLDMWTTEYMQVLDSVDGVVDWYRGTGLRPWLDMLPDEETRQRFLSDYRMLLEPHFKPRPDGHVLFPFWRLFLIGYR